MKCRIGKEYNGRLTKNTYLAKAYRKPDDFSVSITRISPAQAFNEPYMIRKFKDVDAGLVAEFCFTEQHLIDMLTSLRSAKKEWERQDKEREEALVRRRESA